MNNITKYLKHLVVGLAMVSMASHAWADPKSIAVTSIVDHPSLDAVRDGLKEALTEAGYIEGQNLRWQFQSAQGNNSIAAQIARKFVGDKPDVIVAISTPSAQTIMAATRTIPMIFTAVTDPVGAKLTASWEATGTNVTGVSDILDLPLQIDLILRIMPDAKRIGMVYNPAEANSVAVIAEMEKLLAERGMILVTAAAPRTVDVGSAARSLIGKIDVFYANTDNNIVTAMESLVKVAQDAQIPVIASDTPSVSRGAIAALGIDYKEIGRQAATIAIRIFNGENPGDIPPQKLEHIQLFLNPAAAQRQGVIFSDELLAEATTIIE